MQATKAASRFQHRQVWWTKQNSVRFLAEQGHYAVLQQTHRLVFWEVVMDGADE